MFRVDSALTPSVIHIQTLQLLGSTPVVMPDDEVGLVAKTEARPEPPVAEVVVRSGRQVLVKSAQSKGDLAVQGHVVWKQREATQVPRVIVRKRIITRGRNSPRIPLRKDAARDDPVPIATHVLPRATDPVVGDRAIVIRPEYEIMLRLAKANVPAPTLPPALAKNQAGADMVELAHDASEGLGVTLVDNDDLGRPRIALSEGLEKRLHERRPPDRRHNDGDGNRPQR
jgi:hypothetical protein